MFLVLPLNILNLVNLLKCFFLKAYIKYIIVFLKLKSKYNSRILFVKIQVLLHFKNKLRFGHPP